MGSPDAAAALIRPAIAQDAGQIAAIVADLAANTTITFRSRPTPEAEIAAAIEAAAGAGLPYLVAASGGRVAGFASARQFRFEDGNQGSLEHTVFLASWARGAGLGHRLMAALEDAARGAGAVSLIAAISGENVEGCAFHAARGFLPAGRLEAIGCKFGRRIDLIWMQKRL